MGLLGVEMSTTLKRGVSLCGQLLCAILAEIGDHSMHFASDGAYHLIVPGN